MTKDEQIIKAALEDGNLSYSQAAAYRLLLRCAEQLSAMENLEKEEASGGRSAATPSPNQVSGAKPNKGEAPCTTGNVNFSGPAPESGLDPRVVDLVRTNSADWRLQEREAQISALITEKNEALNEVRRLRERVEAQARQISHMFEMGDEADKKHADQVAALTQERDEARRTRNVAQSECNRLLEAKRRLESQIEHDETMRENMARKLAACHIERNKLDAATMVRQPRCIEVT